MAFTRGTFRVRGDKPPKSPPCTRNPRSVSMLGDEIDSLAVLHPLTGDVIRPADHYLPVPASQFTRPGAVTPKKAIASIEEELDDRPRFRSQKQKPFEEAASRMHDAQGKSVVLRAWKTIRCVTSTGRGSGTLRTRCWTTLSRRLLLIIDESHVTVPLRSWRDTLRHTQGTRRLRIPPARRRWTTVLAGRVHPAYRADWAKFWSAPSWPYELERSDGVVEQIIRPTGSADSLVAHAVSHERRTKTKRKTRLCLVVTVGY